MSTPDQPEDAGLIDYEVLQEEDRSNDVQPVEYGEEHPLASLDPRLSDGRTGQAGRTLDAGDVTGTSQ